MPKSTDFPAHLTPEERAGLKKLHAACLAFNELYPAPKRSGTPLNLENVDFDRLRLSLDRLTAERERDREEARRLLEERVRTHGAYRRPLQPRRKQLGVLENHRIRITLPFLQYFLVWPGTHGVTTTADQLLSSMPEKKQKAIQNVLTLPVENKQVLAMMALQELDALTLELLHDLAVASKQYKTSWFHRKTAVMILPNNAATETATHETFHAMSIAAKLSMLAQGTPYDDAHHQLKDAFDAYLDRIQSASARPDWHAFYRETMYPVFARDESTGPEEIFARVDAGIHGDLAVVAEEDINVMAERDYPVPADYPAIVVFCLTEIRDATIRDFGSGRSFLEHTILSLGASLPDTYLASSP
jgi:hypothetical protein